MPTSTFVPGGLWGPATLHHAVAWRARRLLCRWFIEWPWLLGQPLKAPRRAVPPRLFVCLAATKGRGNIHMHIAAPAHSESKGCTEPPANTGPPNASMHPLLAARASVMLGRRRGWQRRRQLGAARRRMR